MIVTYHSIINVFYLHYLIWASCLFSCRQLFPWDTAADSILPAITKDRGKKGSHSANKFLMLSLPAPLRLVSRTLCFGIGLVTDSAKYDWQPMTDMLYARYISTSFVEWVLIFYKKGVQAWEWLDPRPRARKWQNEYWVRFTPCLGPFPLFMKVRW